MDKVFRFACAHRKGVSRVAGAVIGLGISIPVLVFDWPFPVMLFLAFALILVYSVAMGQCSTRLLKPAADVLLERCDPYPYQEELRTHLGYWNGLQLDILLRVDFAMTLHHTGATETALNVMKNIPMNNKGANPVIQAIYYNNLAAFLTHTGDCAGAEAAWEQFRKLAWGKAKKAMEKHYAATLVLAEAQHLYRIGEVPAALDKAAAAPEKTAMDRVCHAWFRAQCYSMLDNHDEARRELNYVIANGNKLSLVNDAWEMMKKLDS